MNRLKKSIKRFKYVANIFIGIVGAFLIFYAQNYVPGREESQSSASAVESYIVYYDLCMGLGCSLIATSLAAVSIIFFSPEDEKKELEEWGILNIYDERSAAADSLKCEQPRRLDVTALCPNDLMEHLGLDASRMRYALENGLKVRIIMLNPQSQSALEQNTYGDIDTKKQVEEFQEWADRINNSVKGRNNIEIKYYSEGPLDFYCRIDDDILTGPYIPGKAADLTMTYQFWAGGKAGKYLDKAFANLWCGQNRRFYLTDSYEEYTVANVDCHIEETMRRFCDRAQEGIKMPVFGVVVIFKGDYRRTVYSCNKPNENYHCHDKFAGTVGQMLRSATGPLNREMVFSDYANSLFFLLRDIRGKEIEVVKVSQNQKYMKSNTKAILSAPIYSGEKLIGAFTFDFAELPPLYEDEVERLSEIQNDGEIGKEDGQWLREIAKLGIECVSELSPMLGQSITSRYKRIYEERWTRNGG